MMEITEDQIKEVLVKNAYQWMRYDTQDMATIYVDDFVKELQSKLKNLGVIGYVSDSLPVKCTMADEKGELGFTEVSIDYAGELITKMSKQQEEVNKFMDAYNEDYR